MVGNDTIGSIVSPDFAASAFWWLCWVMSTKAKRKAQVGPDPKWRSLTDAIFDENELVSGENFFRFDYRWTDAPAVIELQRKSRTFKLSFNDGNILQLPPWELLKDENLPANPVAGAFAFKAVKAVWELMLERFAASVLDGRLELFARPDNFRAAFEPIPHDHWRFYHITDWSTGSATDPNGRQVWSIHASRLSLGKSTSGRKPTYNQDQVNGEVRRLFREFGPYGPDKEEGWRTRADLQEKIAQFLVNTMGQNPSKSTLQKLTILALEAIKLDGN